jgi:hypothetical protein
MAKGQMAVLLWLGYLPLACLLWENSPKQAPYTPLSPGPAGCQARAGFLKGAGKG